jgi:flagellar protein FlaG
MNQILQNVVNLSKVPQAAPNSKKAGSGDTRVQHSQQPTQSVSATDVKDVKDAKPAESRMEATKASAQQLERSAKELADNLNQLVQQRIRRKLQFSVDKSTGSMVIRVIDLETEKTIRQIPSDEILALREHLRSVQEILYDGNLPGLLFSSQV